MEFDSVTVCWQLLGNSAEVVKIEIEEDILETLKEIGKARAATVATALNANRGDASTRLQKCGGTA